MPGLGLTRRVGERVRIGDHHLEVVATRDHFARLEVDGWKRGGRWLRVGDKPFVVGEALVFVTSVGSRCVGLSIVAGDDVRIMRDELERGNQYGTVTKRGGV